MVEIWNLNEDCSVSKNVGDPTMKVTVEDRLNAFERG